MSLFCEGPFCFPQPVCDKLESGCMQKSLVIPIELIILKLRRGLVVLVLDSHFPSILRKIFPVLLRPRLPRKKKNPHLKFHPTFKSKTSPWGMLHFCLIYLPNRPYRPCLCAVAYQLLRQTTNNLSIELIYHQSVLGLIFQSDF